MARSLRSVKNPLDKRRSGALSRLTHEDKVPVTYVNADPVAYMEAVLLKQATSHEVRFSEAFVPGDRCSIPGLPEHPDLFDYVFEEQLAGFPTLPYVP